MGSFSMTPSARRASLRCSKIVARAMEIDPDAWKPHKMTMDEQKGRQQKALYRATAEIDDADDQRELTADSQKGITHT